MSYTVDEYSNLDRAYDWFNADLFSGKLPAVLITYQRKGKSFGYYAPGRFESRTGTERVDEVALNPSAYKGYDDMEALQTLVHEMCHVWQKHFGHPSRNGYHNREWANKMERMGLMPSNTGAPGGKRTGQQMADYTIEGGTFEKSAKALIAEGWQLHWQSVDGLNDRKNGQQQAGTSKKNKIKYTCPGCQANAWGKPGLSLLCGICSSFENLVSMMAD